MGVQGLTIYHVKSHLQVCIVEILLFLKIVDLSNLAFIAYCLYILIPLL